MNLKGKIDDLTAALRGMGLIGDGQSFAVRALAGGISCDVFAVETGGRTLAKEFLNDREKTLDGMLAR
jgi:hypothetical protein